MAERRMFTKKVTDDDNFMSLSSSAQALYLHLSMSSDDDGFSNQISAAMFKAHASIQDLQALLEKRYIYQFESGVIVIKHWRMANALRKDRYTPTVFQEELAQLDLKENGSYTWLPNGCQMVANRLPNGCQMVANRLPQDRLGKDSIDNNNICHEVINYLNQVLGTRYTIKNKTNISNINARISEGHTFEDFKEVIDKKYAQWHNDPKMSSYLRPETLFCSKHFESYLNEIVEVKEAKKETTAEVPKKAYDKIHNFNERRYSKDELEELFFGGEV